METAGLEERTERDEAFMQLALMEARLAAQMPVAEKAARADWTIHNDSTKEKLRAEVQRCVAWLFSRMEKVI